VEINIADIGAEKFLQELQGKDYNEMVTHLQPAMARARLTITGKQIAVVEKLMHKHEQFDPTFVPQLNPITKLGDTDFVIQNGFTNGAAAPQTMDIDILDLPLPGTSA